jgi:DNA-binding response OmpR family regulator
LVANPNSAATLRAKGHPLGRETVATILVVEDVEEIASNMERALIQREHKVLVALDAEQAIQIAEKALPAVVLTDPDLPTFDRLLELVSEHRYLKEVPIVVIDVDELQLDGRIEVLRDFEALDNLIDSLQSSR